MSVESTKGTIIFVFKLYNENLFSLCVCCLDQRIHKEYTKYEKRRTNKTTSLCETDFKKLYICNQ